MEEICMETNYVQKHVWSHEWDKLYSKNSRLYHNTISPGCTTLSAHQLSAPIPSSIEECIFYKINRRATIGLVIYEVSRHTMTNNQPYIHFIQSLVQYEHWTLETISRKLNPYIWMVIHNRNTRNVSDPKDPPSVLSIKNPSGTATYLPFSHKLNEHSTWNLVRYALFDFHYLVIL